MNRMYMSEREYYCYLKKKRREREIFRKLFIFFMSTFILITCALSYHVIVSNAENEDAVVSYKYFDSITIEDGDTLWHIADTYNDGIHYASNQDYIEEVMQINHLSDETIHSGYQLIIPYYSNEFVY